MPTPLVRHNGDVSDELSGKLVRVLTTLSVAEGHLARGLLESDGIPAFLKGEGDGPYRLGPVFVYVPTEFEVQARMALDTIEGVAEQNP